LVLSPIVDSIFSPPKASSPDSSLGSVDLPSSFESLGLFFLSFCFGYGLSRSIFDEGLKESRPSTLSPPLARDIFVGRLIFDEPES
jgi:hypothetical protein